MTSSPTCPECGNLGVLADSSVVYGESYGMIWHCHECGTYVGCHKDTDVPLGTMAGMELRRKRREAHSALDPLWKSGRMERTKVYEWLASRLGMQTEDCHVAKFDESQCEMVIRLALYKRGLLGVKRPKR